MALFTIEIIKGVSTIIETVEAEVYCIKGSTYKFQNTIKRMNGPPHCYSVKEYPAEDIISVKRTDQ